MKSFCLALLMLGCVGCGKKVDDYKSVAWHHFPDGIQVISGAQTHGTFPVPRAKSEHPQPIWFEHPYWDQYAMDGFWQCPVGFVQTYGNGGMSPSRNGEISGGSEDQDKVPSCRLPHKGEFEAKP